MGSGSESSTDDEAPPTPNRGGSWSRGEAFFSEEEDDEEEEEEDTERRNHGASSSSSSHRMAPTNLETTWRRLVRVAEKEIERLNIVNNELREDLRRVTTQNLMLLQENHELRNGRYEIAKVRAELKRLHTAHVEARKARDVKFNLELENMALDTAKTMRQAEVDELEQQAKAVTKELDDTKAQVNREKRKVQKMKDEASSDYAHFTRIKEENEARIKHLSSEVRRKESALAELEEQIRNRAATPDATVNQLAVWRVRPLLNAESSQSEPSLPPILAFVENSQPTSLDLIFRSILPRSLRQFVVDFDPLWYQIPDVVYLPNRRTLDSRGKPFQDARLLALLSRTDLRNRLALYDNPTLTDTVMPYLRVLVLLGWAKAYVDYASVELDVDISPVEETVHDLLTAITNNPLFEQLLDLGVHSFARRYWTDLCLSHHLPEPELLETGLVEEEEEEEDIKDRLSTFALF